MEDLLRRLKLAGSISLLYGIPGIGISRLLQYFFDNRLNNDESILVRFESSNTFVVNAEEKFSQDTFVTQVLGKINNNSTVMLDQFDLASDELQQVIFKFWSKMAFEMNLKLIISIQKNNLQNFISLSKKFQLQIDSVQLEPLNDEEQLDFLSARGCHELRHSVVLSAEQKKMLKITKGIFSQLENFQRQNEHEVNCAELMHHRRWSFAQKSVLGFLTVLALFSVWTGLQNAEFQDSVSSYFNSQAKAVVSRDIPFDLAVQNLPVQHEISDSKQPEEVPDKNVHENEPLAAEAGIIDSGDKNQSMKSDINSVVLRPGQGVQLKTDTVQKINQTVFQQRLMATEKWLDSVDKKSASIQIMTIGTDQNPEQSLNRYLKKLQSKQIDLEKIKIYPLTKKNKLMYGVLYGEYTSFHQAGREIKSLPDFLKANKPFPRSVKGITDEMNSF